MHLAPVLDLPEIAYAHGVRRAVISPGSRSAPLAVAFERHPGIDTVVVPDERAAGFVGLGMVEEACQPVVLICTSGTALMNYGPAVAEAWYKNLPLCVLSADRPPELIDQADGQTIRQPGVYGRHVKTTCDLPVSVDSQTGTRLQEMAIEALSTAMTCPQGPVHINVPLREPFYPTGTDESKWSAAGLKVSDPERPQVTELPPVPDAWNRILVVVGQGQMTCELAEALKLLVAEGVPVLADATANAHDVPGVVCHHEAVLASGARRPPEPQLVVSCGGPVLSKGLKTFLRTCTGSAHWHILPAGDAPDTFGILSATLHGRPEHILPQMLGQVAAPDREFYRGWREMDAAGCQAVESATMEFSFLSAVSRVLAALPVGAVLHAGNSMAVRYVDAIGLPTGQDVRLYSNRGTSGIDGCVSTAVGHALCEDPESSRLHIALVGDLSFLYDSNAFWVEPLPPSLRVIVLNDGGGGIFEMIPGPPSLKECERLFVAPHAQRLSAIADRWDIPHMQAADAASLDSALKDLFGTDPGIKVLEIPASREDNIRAWKSTRAITES